MNKLTTAELITINADNLSERHFEIDRDELIKRVEYTKELTVNGVDDKEGFEAVVTARKDHKQLRIAVEKRRKKLKAGALEYGKKVDSIAAEIKGIIEPEELRLKALEDGIKAEIQRAKDDITNSRMQQLAEVQSEMNRDYVSVLSDEQFTKVLEEQTAKFDKKRERERAEEAERVEREKEEQERIRKEDERLEAERKEIEEKRQRQEAEQAEERKREEQRLADERAKLKADREEFEEQQRIQREERERVEAEKQRLIDEANAKRIAKEREEFEARQRELMLQMQPDREKLLRYADALDAVEFPSVSPVAESCAAGVLAVVRNAVDEIRELIQSEVSK